MLALGLLYILLLVNFFLLSSVNCHSFVVFAALLFQFDICSTFTMLYITVFRLLCVC